MGQLSVYLCSFVNITELIVIKSGLRFIAVGEVRGEFGVLPPLRGHVNDASVSGANVPLNPDPKLKQPLALGQIIS